jgi:hypothetical protein
MIDSSMSPSNSFRNIALAASRLLLLIDLAATAGVSLNSGDKRCRICRLAKLSVGNITRNGAGSMAIVRPSQFSPHSVLAPDWLPKINTTRRMRRSLGLSRSIGSLRNGTRSVRHSPGSELLRRVSCRSASAHSLTVRSSGGCSAAMNASR